MEYTLTQEMVKEYERHLRLAERSSGTILKYLHNIEQFRRYLPREAAVTKEMVIAYKKSHKYSKCSTGGAEWAIFVFRMARLQSKAVQTAKMHFSG